MELKKIIEEINNAFFRLNSFANGNVKTYTSFDFDYAFTLLFNEVRKPNNYNISNCNSIGQYWNITENIRVSFDKSTFENNDVYLNEDFCNDCNAITSLNWDRIDEFMEFSTDNKEESLSIIDYLQAITPQPTTPQITLTATIQQEAGETVFEILKDFFNVEQQDEVKRVLLTMGTASEKLVFNSNGNKLSDTFKQLIENNLITGLSKKELIDWIVLNFSFVHRGEVKSFNNKTVAQTISENLKTCIKPLIEISNGKIRRGEKKERKKN